MIDFKERLNSEFLDLFFKVERLERFIESEEDFKNLSPHEKDLLTLQFQIMRIYLRILKDRISYYSSGSGLRKMIPNRLFELYNSI